MRSTITVRLPRGLAEWLEETSSATGISRSEIIRGELEKAKQGAENGFMRLAGTVSGPQDYSQRKGFSTK